MDRERLSNESYRTGLYMKESRRINHFDEVITDKLICFSLPGKRQTDSLVVRSACRTCCLLDDRGTDAETSKDLV